MANTRRPQTANLKPWKPGTSGNARGRPKSDFDLADKARPHTTLAIETLVECCGDAKAPWAARVSAAGEILDRGWGRAPATLDVNNTYSFSEEFESFVSHLNEQRKAGHLKVINGDVEDEGGRVRLAGERIQ